ncbi:hypothetical protein [Kitasatospora sp. NPDC001175]|uniref:hypothetical protein n=1 Tax=Kitasatospora sp. NPDC001175 TaxID=3157103 RepID=UPI003D02C9B4
MYAPGDQLDADLHGIHDGWTIHATATVLATVPGRPTGILLAITSTTGPGMFYANGTLSTTLNGPHPVAVQRPFTTGMQPNRITLGARTGRHPQHADPIAMDAMREAAYSALSPYSALGTRTPLDPYYLPMLDRAAADVADRRDHIPPAEQARDVLIRRFLASGVQPAEIRDRTGLSTSRISQIKKTPQDAVPAA